MKMQTRPLRILDFDLEQRPLTYWTPDRPTGDITAIAAGWTNQSVSKVQARLVGQVSQREMLEWFVGLYDEADMVTGHYIRRFDLKQLQAALAEHGLPGLKPKLVQDTKTDLIRWGDLPASQEYLAEMLGIRAPKVPMSQHSWRQSNRLTDGGLMLTYRRVVGDVRQHMAMRKALVKRGLLKPPSMWRPK